MIYLDNAATTHYKPQCVIDTVTQVLTRYSYNANRSGSKGSIALQNKILDTRQAICTLVGGQDATHVVFTNNCTGALNLAILGHARKSGHIITTSTEHNSVLRPITHLQQRGMAEVTHLEPNSDGNITPDILLGALRDDTYMVVLNHCSNVTGKCQDISALGKALKRAKPDVLLTIDLAQSIGYVPCNMSQCLADMVALPAHKGLHGIQGCGALVFTSNSIPRPILLGGTGTDSHSLTQPTTIPDGLEAGTLNSVSILALYSALEWWAYNHHSHRNTMTNLQHTLVDGLNSIHGVKTHSTYNDSGIVSFALHDYDSTVISDILSTKYDICTRGGLHCAPLMHRHLRTTDTGLVRASIAYNNTMNDCYTLLNAVDRLAHSIH